MQKFDTPAAVTAVVNIAAGRIQVIAADRADTVVEVRPADLTKDRDTKAAEQTTVEFTDGVVTITGPAQKNQIFGASGSIEVTVQLPAGSQVEAKAGAAEFRGVGRLGEVVCDGANGEIKIDEAASVRLSADAGDVTIGRLAGAAEISTQKGDITIAEATTGSVVLRTQLGNVSVTAAHGASATLDAKTSFGRISNSLNNADGANAALAIHATTEYGDITARSL
ncbi:DUF4097 family beta strand repeat-containing protein [Kribbella deserti]|uniref:DUF4097 family beta strand repeat-containing protein n=1 Tax=Kribbella deserti TaxID=1926257 RepID=A0ABV6QEP8_9ACTN